MGCKQQQLHECDAHDWPGFQTGSPCLQFLHELESGVHNPGTGNGKISRKLSSRP
jgi:hypothetical protein